MMLENDMLLIDNAFSDKLFDPILFFVWDILYIHICIPTNIIHS